MERDKVSLKYVILEKEVFKNKRGGYAHIINVARILGFTFNLTILGRNYSENDLEQESIFYNQKFSFLRILWTLGCDFKSTFLIRKYFPALPILFILIVFKKITLSKQKFYIEVNGISGDYVVRNRILNILFLVLNILLLKVYDGIYVVNANLKNRLSSFRVLDPNKIIICSNGGLPSPYSSSPRIFNLQLNSPINIIYYGDNQSHYYLDDFVRSIQLFESSIRRFNLFIIGQGYSKTFPSFVNLCGRMNLNELFRFVSKLDGLSFGLIPLGFNSSTTDNDVCPIKYFDYLYCGIPVISSSNCLGLVENRTHIYSYDLFSDDSIQEVLDRIDKMDDATYKLSHQASVINSLEYSWGNTLKNLVNMISSNPLS